MNKSSIAIIVFLLLVLVGWLAVDYLVIGDDVEAPVVTSAILTPVDPTLDTSYVADLEERRNTRIGEELEL